MIVNNNSSWTANHRCCWIQNFDFYWRNDWV